MKIFVSHASSDRAAASDLGRELRLQGYIVWDSSRIEPGQNPSAAAANAMETADALLVLWSTKSSKSLWVRRELEYALARPQFEDRVILVALESGVQETAPWVMRRLWTVQGNAQRGWASVIEAVKGLSDDPAR